MSTPCRPSRVGTVFRLICIAAGLAAGSLSAAEPFRLPSRSRIETAKGSGQWQVVEKVQEWDPARTAVVICDMWDQHWCQGATRRVAEMAPRMNEVVKAARAGGALIIHCPSDTLKFYEGTPQRRLAQSAPKAPNRPEGWRSLDPSREPPLPIDDADGGCDDWPQCRQHGPWKRQIATIEIADGDAITDSDEAYNLMMARGITNVVVMGVHLNMCVLGRPFSIRNMVSKGQNVVFVRDLTDTMYNSRRPPFVSHFAGTDLVAEHIERYWCPSVTSVAFLGGEPFRFRDDRRPKVVLLIGEDEYRTWETLPEFAEKDLRWRGLEVRIVTADPADKHRFPGLTDALREADLLVVSTRRRALPKADLEAIRAHLAAGRPVAGLRTASHGFDPRGEDARRGAAWPEFDPEVLGGHYAGHHGQGPKTAVKVIAEAAGHPILVGVDPSALIGNGSLYKVTPLKPGTTPLLIGTIPGKPSEPVAWVNTYGPAKARVFYTSLGHPEDFAEPAFRRLLLNGILWALDRPIPPATGDSKPAAPAAAVISPGPAAVSAPAAAAANREAESEKYEKLVPASPPLAPEESARRFTVVDGLEMELVLSEPEIAQPLHVSFDERGRLWLAEYRQYPAPAGLKLVSHDQFWRAVYDRVPPPPPNHFPGRDRISIHEDTDGDGRYDRHTVFVDGLNIATAVAKGRGGVWVLNPPYLLFYPDRNDDEVPDGDPEVRLEGFGLEDTHSVVNSLRWGPDGWLYAAQGSTVSGRVRQPGSTNAPVHTLGQNIWRYHPETRRYEVFAEGGGNAFGVEIDDEGRIFSGHNGGNTRGFHYVQGGYLQKGFEKHGQLSNPHAYGYFPQMAHNDVERFTHTFVFYGGGTFSAEFDDRLFGVEPLQGRIVMSERTRVGSTFRTKDVGYAVTSRDPWFKPVDIKHGPDGALYIADWYDFQVNHWRNYQGNMDAGNGRVYRLKARGARPAKFEDLRRVPGSRLVALLSDGNRWVRDTARRLLADRRDRSVIPPLRELLEADGTPSSLEALWALRSVGGWSTEVVRRGLTHRQPVVREWTVRLMGDDGAVPAEAWDVLVGWVGSETDRSVRQQIAASARRFPSSQGLALVRRLMDHDEDATDDRQPLMIWWAIEARAATDRAAILAWFDDASVWDRPLVRDQLIERLMRRYAAAGTVEDFAACERLLTRAPADVHRARLMTGFEKAFEGRTLAGLPASLLEALARAGGGSVALQLRTGRPEAVARALALVEDEKGNPSSRVQVIQALGESKEGAAVPVLLAAVNSSKEPVRLAALGALQAFDAPNIADDVLGRWPRMTEATRSAALNLLATRPGWALQLARAVDGGAVSAGSVPLDVARRMKRHRGSELGELLARHWPRTGRPTSDEMERQIRRMAGVVESGSGNPFEGKKLYTANCANCHRLFAVGGEVGPDLTPYRRDDLETLLLNIVNPGAEIREGYENMLVETKDDRSLSGYMVRQDDRLVVLRGLDGQDLVLRREEIAELRAAGMSLMPEGLLEPLDDQQLRDLFAYLRSSQPLVN